jgi:hypothetical protein
MASEERSPDWSEYDEEQLRQIICAIAEELAWRAQR